MMVQCWKVEGKIFERSKMTVEYGRMLDMEKISQSVASMIEEN